MNFDREPGAPQESGKDQIFRDKIDQIRSWNNITDMPVIFGNVAIAGFTISDILKAHGYRSAPLQDWKSNIPELDPAILDLGCGSDHDDKNRLLEWFPYVPVIFGTHGADPKRIVGVDLMPFKYAEGIYTHLTTDLVSLIKSGTLLEFLKPNIPEGKFNAIVMNNFFNSPELHETLRKNAMDENTFRIKFQDQLLELLSPDGVIIRNG